LPCFASGHVVTHGERWVRSAALTFPRVSSTCYVNGRFDIVVELDTCGYAVIDFKTASPSGEKAEMYARQLQAYALALENPAPDALRFSQIEALGLLLFFSPDKWEQNASQRQLLEGSMEWMPIMRNDAAFMDFLESVVALLDGPLPDAEPDACDWCRYRGTDTCAARKRYYPCRFVGN
jgi:PD-(D/E)XK nuclease superfamily